VLIATVMRIRSGYGSIGVPTRVSSGSLGTRALGYGGDLDQNATVSTDLPLVARRAELALLTGAIETARRAVRATLCCSPARPEWEKPAC